MEVFYNKTVTVYNRSISDDVMGNETWYPTVLENVRLLVSKGANIATSGITSADSAKLHVKSLEKYLKPIEWNESTEKSEHFTFKDGEDFFVEGDTSSEDTKVDNFYGYMKSHYDNCFKVTNVDKYDLIQHLEVGGE